MPIPMRMLVEWFTCSECVRAIVLFDVSRVVFAEGSLFSYLWRAKRKFCWREEGRETEAFLYDYRDGSRIMLCVL